MRKASNHLIIGGAGKSSSNANSNGPSNGGGNNNATGGGPEGRNRSTSRGRLQHPNEDGHDSSSVGSAGGDSFDSSGHNSPGVGVAASANDIPRSESTVELRNRSKLLNGMQSKNSLFRKSLPASAHLDDSDGNNADNDSVGSFISSTSRQHHPFLETDR